MFVAAVTLLAGDYLLQKAWQKKQTVENPLAD